MNPQFSFTAVEASAPQVAGSLPPFEELDAPVYDQIHQEQSVAGETTQNTFQNPAVQEQVMFQEIPQAPQVVDSFPLLEDVALCENNQVHQEQIVATVQPHVLLQGIPVVQVAERTQELIVETIDVNSQASQMTLNTSSTSTRQFEITSSSSTSTSNDRLAALASMLGSCLEQLTPLADMGEETERIEMLSKRLLEPPLPGPPMVELDRTSAKCRRRKWHTPLPGKRSVPGSECVATFATRLMVWTMSDMTLWAGAWHPPTLSWVPLSSVLQSEGSVCNVKEKLRYIGADYDTIHLK